MLRHVAERNRRRMGTLHLLAFRLPTILPPRLVCGWSSRLPSTKSRSPLMISTLKVLNVLKSMLLHIYLRRGPMSVRFPRSPVGSHCRLDDVGQILWNEKRPAATINHIEKEPPTTLLQVCLNPVVPSWAQIKMGQNIFFEIFLTDFDLVRWFIGNEATVFGTYLTKS